MIRCCWINPSLIRPSLGGITPRNIPTKRNFDQEEFEISTERNFRREEFPPRKIYKITMAYPLTAADTQFDKITDNLYISAASAVTPDKLRRNGIKLIINCTDDPLLNNPDIESVMLSVEDTPTHRISVHFDKCADKIKAARDNGGCTLVYCTAGISRSASVCVAYLMKYHRMNLKDSYYFLKSIRSCIHPNPGFFRQLIEYEKKIFGSTTVAIVSSPDGLIPDVYKNDPDNAVLMPLPDPPGPDR